MNNKTQVPDVEAFLNNNETRSGQINFNDVRDLAAQYQKVIDEQATTNEFQTRELVEKQKYILHLEAQLSYLCGAVPATNCKDCKGTGIAQYEYGPTECPKCKGVGNV